MTLANELVIQTHNLGKTFKEVQALQSVNLEVPRNSIFGFLGPNGAGKTTLMKLLLGLSKPTAGNGTIFGHDIIQDSVAIRERIGYLPQQPRFIEYMTAQQNLLFNAKFYFSGPQAKIQDRCTEMLHLVGLENKADRPIKGFSGGEKQRLGIALAQINYPDLLILDEPASALDPVGRQEVLEVMARLQKHTTIFYSTHILDDVQRVSDRVAILNQGHLVASGPIQEILSGQDGVVFTIKLKAPLNDLSKQLAEFPWVIRLDFSQEKNGCIYHVTVRDESIAEANLLRLVLANPEAIVTSFSRKKYELENVFMEIVKGVNHGRKPGN